MKKLLLSTFALCFFTFSFAQEYGWVDISKNIPNQNATQLSDIHFIDENEGWISTSSFAEIYHTSDGGQTFEIQTIQMPAQHIHMRDKNRGYAGGASGTVFYTNNGGKNWNLLNNFLPSTVRGITFPAQSDTGFICGNSGWVGKIDSIHIFDTEKLVNADLCAISFPAEGEGWVCGGSIIRHYLNGEWTAELNGSGGYYSSMSFVNQTHGWITGDGGKIIHTEDGYNFTTQLSYGSGCTLNDIFFFDELNGWAVGSHHILSTTNGGTDWYVDTVSTRSPATLASVQFTNEKLGYVCGGREIEGTINYDPAFYKYTLLSESDSTNATLSTIKIDDASLENFNSATYEYSVELPTGTTEVPQVSATAAISGATVNITQASSLSGTASIVVTAKDGQTQQTYTIHFSVVTGIENFERKNVLNIYPNPVSGILYFEQLPETTTFDLKIMDIHGQMVCSKKSFSQKSIDVSDLQAGVYFLSLQSKNETLNTRFIKK